MNMRLPPLLPASKPKEEYHLDKADGTRMSNGWRPLRKLKPKHLKAVKMHLEGFSNIDIAATMQWAPSYVSSLLQDPSCQEIIQRVRGDWEREFDSLEGLAVDSLRRSLKSTNEKNRLRATSMFLQERRERDKASGGGHESAEDVIQRMLQVNLNLQINTGPGGSS